MGSAGAHPLFGKMEFAFLLPPLLKSKKDVKETDPFYGLCDDVHFGRSCLLSAGVAKA